MKKKILFVSIALLFWGFQAGYTEIICTETEYDSGYIKKLPTIDQEEIFQLKNPLFENSKVKYRVTLGRGSPLHNKRLRIEEGILENVKFRIYYTDGSGTIQGLPTNTLSVIKDKSGSNWDISVRIDKMDDTHFCFLSRGDLVVGIWKDGAPFVRVGSSHYPNSNIAVRVDKNEPVSAPEKTGFTNAQAARIVEQLSKGKSLLTRYQEWPNQSYKDKSIELFGFPQAWAILQKIFNSVKLK